MNRVRFAPSPTGYLHVGGARTALFNWLYARHTGGRLILRIEDTDAARNTPEAMAAILDGLRWLDIDWDEGPEVGGEFGPYFQSERKSIYDRYFEKIQSAGLTYDDGGAIRVRSPRGRRVVHDLVCGEVLVDRTHEPDMTIRRPDGSYIFHFVNVVDDIEMQITHVIRGEDHLMNTAKHLELYEALGAEPPQFAHIPLILNEDGSKMSKRDRGASLGSYPAEGFLPQAVRNYLCLLGWSPKDDREKLPIEDVIALFDWDHLNKSNARFDLAKCTWLNAQYVHALPLADFRESAKPFLHAAGIPLDGNDDFLDRALAPIQEKIHLMSEVPPWVAYLFNEDFPYDPDAAEKAFVGKPQAIELLTGLLQAFDGLDDWGPESLSEAMKATATAAGVKPGAIMLPCRVALSGQTFGPGLTDILTLLGRDRTLSRIRRTVDMFR